MIRSGIIASFALTMFAGMFAWGYAAGAHGAFPYSILRDTKAALFPPASRTNVEYRLTRVPEISAEPYSALATRAEVVMVGDSITAGGRWDELFPEVSIINRGVPGDQVGGLELRTQSILGAEPERIFVMIGINDVAALNSNDQIMERFVRVSEALRSQGATLYIQSIIPCRISEFGSCTRQMQEQIRALNSRLGELAAVDGAIYLALDQVMADENGFLEEFSIDGVHPSSAGFAKWRDLIAAHVTQEGPPS